MKKCPQCTRIYIDREQNFCLHDGARLIDDNSSTEHQTAILGANPHLESGTRLFTADPQAMTLSMSGYQPNSIAVLPFAHLSSDADDEYFCDGLAEELINALSRVDDLKVVGRASSFSFKNKPIDVAQVGALLNVNNVVEGSVRKFGERMRINVSLTSTADGFNVWSEMYDTELRNIFDVQDEITRSVVNALKRKLLGDDLRSGDQMTSLIEDLKQHVTELEAYQLYLRGRFLVNKLNPEDFIRAIECFEKAIAIDPTYAAAYSGLADAHMLSSELSNVPPQVGMPKAKAAAQKAIELDPNSSEAHASLGFVLQDYDYEFEAAEAAFVRSIELNSNNPHALHLYSGFLAQMGRPNEAERMCRRSLAIDPISPMGHWIYAFVLFIIRKYDESIAESRETLALDAAFSAAHLTLSFAHQMKGEYAESVAAYVKFSEMCGLADKAAIFKKAFDEGGWTGYLEAVTAPETRPDVTAYIIGVYQALLGRNEEAFESLDRSFANREPHIVMLKVDPRFDHLRSDPRFQQLLLNIGFP